MADPRQSTDDKERRFKLVTHGPQGQVIVHQTLDDPTAAMKAYVDLYKVEMTNQYLGQSLPKGAHISLVDKQHKLDASFISEGKGTYRSSFYKEESRIAFENALELPSARPTGLGKQSEARGEQLATKDIPWNDLSARDQGSKLGELVSGRPVRLPSSAPTGLHQANAALQAQRGEDGWESLSSIPEAGMRINLNTRMAEVRIDGTNANLTGRAAISEWCAQHHASLQDEQRLQAFDIAAAKGLAPGRPSPITNEKEFSSMTTTPATQAERQPREDVKRIGDHMPKPDWQESINLLKAKAPQEASRIYIPKAGGEYAGQVLLVTDTHVVQRIGRGTAVAHDLSKLDNGKALGDLADQGGLRPGTQMTVKYGQDRGQGTVIPFNQHRASEVSRELSAWAEKNITNARGKETFLKHLSAATQDMAQPRAAQTKPQPSRTSPAPQPTRTKAPERNR